MSYVIFVNPTAAEPDHVMPRNPPMLSSSPRQEQRPSLCSPAPSTDERPLRPTRFSGSCAGRDGPTACAAVSFHASFGSVFRIQGATPVWKSASELG